MPQDAMEPPTSTATTRETEPEVVAGISSAEGSPDMPTDIRIGGAGWSAWWLLPLLGAGVALGYGAMRLLRRRS